MQRHRRSKDHRPTKVDGQPADLRVDLRRDDIDERTLSGNRVALGHDNRVGETGAGELVQVRRIRPQQVGGLHLRAQQLQTPEPFGDLAAVWILRRGRGRLVESRRGVQVDEAGIDREARAFDALHIARRVGPSIDRDDLAAANHDGALLDRRTRHREQCEHRQSRSPAPPPHGTSPTPLAATSVAVRTNLRITFSVTGFRPASLFAECRAKALPHNRLTTALPRAFRTAACACCPRPRCGR